MHLIQNVTNIIFKNDQTISINLDDVPSMVIDTDSLLITTMVLENDSSSVKMNLFV